MFVNVFLAGIFPPPPHNGDNKLNSNGTLYSVKDSDFQNLDMGGVSSHQGLEGGVLIPHSRSFFTRIPYPALFHRYPESLFFFLKNTFKKD